MQPSINILQSLFVKDNNDQVIHLFVHSYNLKKKKKRLSTVLHTAFISLTLVYGTINLSNFSTIFLFLFLKFLWEGTFLEIKFEFYIYIYILIPITWDLLSAIFNSVWPFYIFSKCKCLCFYSFIFNARLLNSMHL